MNIETLFTCKKGMVIAPAGCGKTQTIVDALKFSTTKPCLVLTHTTAGVAVLKQRLKSHGVPHQRYSVATVAGWAISVIARFPVISGTSIGTSVQPNYSGIQKVAANLCTQGHIDKILIASYCRLFVDEYQDCSITQHNLVNALSRILPVVVFGDPMQAIFGFGNDPLPN